MQIVFAEKTNSPSCQNIVCFPVEETPQILKNNKKKMDLMINSTLMERKKTDCNALPKGWQREEISRKGGLSAGKVDVIYYR